MAGMRAVHKKDGTTFKFTGDLKEAIEKALDSYNRRVKDLRDFIRLGKEELEKGKQEAEAGHEEN